MKLIAAVLTLIVCGSAQFTPDDAGGREAAQQIAERATEQNLQEYADDEQAMVRPGLLADRRTKTITLWGAATALAADEPCEFFLIHDQSGKDYEALAIAFARPSDVDAALKFLGTPGSPGRPVDYSQLMFWPKGERVIMRFQWTDEAGAGHDVRAEDLIRDLRMDKPLERTGLVYVGSRWIERDNGERVMAADANDVGSIASTYNEPTTLLDVPRRAEQGAVYGLFKPNAEYKFSRYQPITITIGPERREGLPPRVIDITLRYSANKRFLLIDTDGKTMNAVASLDSALGLLAGLIDREPFVRVEPERNVPVGYAQQVARLLDAIEVERGIRIEPPPEGHLYYRAFLPDPQWRDRSKRVIGGWELHVAPAPGKDDALSLKLLEIHDGVDAEGLPAIVETEHESRGAATLAKVLADSDGPRPRNLYVFAPHDLDYGRLCDVLADVLKTRRTIYVFLPTGP